MITLLTNQFILVALALMPAFIIAGAVYVWSRIQTRGNRAPVKDKLLRSPGESLRRQMEKFDENLPSYICLALLYGPVCFLALAGYAKSRIQSPHLAAELVALSVLVLPGMLLLTRKAIQMIAQQRNLSLGFRGERAVGEELNKLMFDGCFVFHDIPGDAEWNIDHVVVAPTGVFAIETKTRRKGRCPKGKRDYEVVYDGKRLEYPHCKDSHGIEQVKANAKWLGRHLTNSLAEEIKATPILTLPGWLVTNRTKPDSNQLLVLSHKQIRSAILECRPQLLEKKRMQQIAYNIDQRCRDVEF
jgi:hypothetical protein